MNKRENDYGAETVFGLLMLILGWVFILVATAPGFLETAI